MGVLFGKKLKTNNMQKEFVTYEQSLALKELGFDEPCFGYYDKSMQVYDLLRFDKIVKKITNKNEWFILAPLYQQAFRWFREKYGLYTEMFVDDDKTFGFMITYFTSEGRADTPIKYNYVTYEEAEQACLDKLIEIVKTNK